MRLPALSQPLSLVPQPPQHFLSSFHSRNKEGREGREAGDSHSKLLLVHQMQHDLFPFWTFAHAACEARDHVLKGVGQWGVPSWL